MDEIFPIISIEKMYEKLQEGYDFISGTRYSKGGARLGGSFIGSVLSRTANKVFNLISKIPLTDCTTGIKMMRKKFGIVLIFNQILSVGLLLLKFRLSHILKNINYLNTLLNLLIDYLEDLLHLN